MESQLLDLIGKIYDGVGTEDGWTDILNDFGDLSGGAASVLIASPKTGQARIVSPYYDAEFTDKCVGIWADKDETFPASLMAPVGHTVTLEDSGRDKFLKGQFYNDLWRHSEHGVERLRSNIVRNADLQLCFGVNPYARRDEISRNMALTFKAALPHFIRAVELQWRMHRLELERAMNSNFNDSAVLVVNSECRILIADPAADRLLSMHGPLFVRNGVLRARQAADTNNIHAMVASCAPRTTGYHLRGGTASINYPKMGQFNISIAPVPVGETNFSFDAGSNGEPAAIVLLDDVETRRKTALRKLGHHYGLTPTEALVAAKCLSGASREAMAQELAVSDATVRTHLSKIYEKTGVKRRPELVSLLHREGWAEALL